MEKINILCYSNLTPKYVAFHANELRDQMNLVGFIHDSLPTKKYPGEIDKLNDIKTEISRYISMANEKGINKNYIKIGLDQGNICAWDDDQGWKNQLNELKKTVQWAIDCGFAGVALDTECYNKTLYNSQVWTGKYRWIIRDRGEQLLNAIISVKKDIEILIILEGALFAQHNERKRSNGIYKIYIDEEDMVSLYKNNIFTPFAKIKSIDELNNYNLTYDEKKIYKDLISGFYKYDYWIYFFEGFAKSKPETGIHLFLETTYKIWNPFTLFSIKRQVKKLIGDMVEDQEYWNDKCSLSFGLWTLGEGYVNKNRKMSVWQFWLQLKIALMFCKKFIWIYTEGLGWWHIPDGERWGIDPQEAKMPLDNDIQKFKKVLVENTIIK